MEYSRLFGSQFPDQQLVIQEKVDVDNSIVTIVNRIENYVKAGDMVNASKVYEDNKDILDPFIINSAFINLLQEEIFNVGLLALSKQSNIVSSDMPTTQEVAGGYWIQDYE